MRTALLSPSSLRGSGIGEIQQHCSHPLLCGAGALPNLSCCCTRPAPEKGKGIARPQHPVLTMLLCIRQD